MNLIIQLVSEYSALLVALLVIGTILSIVRITNSRIKEKGKRVFKFLEWVSLPPGYLYLFVSLQQNSVYYFASYPKASIAVHLLLVAFSGLLLYPRKKNLLFNWFRGLIGVPVMIYSLVIIGLYFQSRENFEALGSTFEKLAATEGEIAPDFLFSLVLGKEDRRLVDYKGSLVLLNVWATWCGPCLVELPDLNELQITFKDRGLVVINLSDESYEKIETYLQRYPMATTHGRVDSGKNVPEFYQFGRTRPTSFLINRNGEVVKAIVGAKTYKYFEKIVELNL